MSSRIKAFSAIIFTSIVWGMSFINIKICLNVFPPLSLAFFRFLIATVIIFTIGRMSGTEFKIRKQDAHLFVLAGILGISAYFYFENNGINLISPSLASIIIGTIPIFMVLAESLFFKTRITGIKAVSGIISLCGIYVICMRDFTNMHSNVKGYFFMFGAVACFVAYNISARTLFERYSNLNIAFYQSLFGTLFLIPSLFVEDVKYELIDTSIVLNLLFLAVVCSAIAYYLYIYSLEKLNASICSLYINLGPIITMTFAYMVLGEVPKINQIAGSVLILMSVYLVSFEEKIYKYISIRFGKSKKAS